MNLIVLKFLLQNCVGENSFARRAVLITHDNMCYLGIHDDPQDFLVLAWSQTDKNNNRWMTTIHALESLVGHKRLSLFKVAVDPARRFDFILCLDNQTA